MRPIAYQFRAVARAAGAKTAAALRTAARVGTGDLAGSSRAQLGTQLRSAQSGIRRTLFAVALSPTTLATALALATIASPASATTRPHYGGTLRITMQSAPNSLVLPTDATPAEYWDAVRALSLIGDTLVNLDTEARPQPALAVAWQSDPSFRHWKFTIRARAKFHDGTAASPEAIAQILSTIHPDWSFHPSADSLAIDTTTPMPLLPAELALPHNLLLKRNAAGVPIGTGAFLVSDWQPGKFLKLAANEESWAGRPFVDAIVIEFGKSLRDQSIALELDKTDVIESATPAPNESRLRSTTFSSYISLPVELMTLVFPTNSRALDTRVREALALAIDRNPIQSVLLKGAGEPAASILPNWMTGYTAVFSAPANLQQARAALANSRQPALNLSYDPGDAQAQLIAERIALDAREVGITLHVSLSASPDIRLMRVVLPSPDPAMSLADALRQLGLPRLTLAIAPRRDSLEDLYQAERSLLDRHEVIPLFHLPTTTTVGARVRNWKPDELGEWNGTSHSLADAWLADTRTTNTAEDSRYEAAKP